MTNMWSDKKYINVIINVLLFLMGINFMHIGQLFLPIISLILFIDNKFRLKINNYFIFIVLCLFALTFCIFSYKLGFYCFIGFCLPMAYYIGCNLNVSENNIKNLIYILAFGMASHLVLDFIFESFLFDFDFQRIFGKVSHYDIWISINTLLRGDELYQNGRIKTTVLSLNYMLILACFFYLFVFENNKKIKTIGISLFIISSIYCLALGRRTTFLMFIIILFISLIYYFIYIKKIDIKNFVKYILMLLFIFFLSVVVVYINLFDIRTYLSRFTLFAKFFRQGLDSDRITIFIDSIKYYTQYLWGGQKISESVGSLIHNMWGDIYDYAGIIPFSLMLVYTIFSIKVGIKFIKNKLISTSFKLVIINVYICSFSAMLLEPLLSAFSLLLIVIVLLISSFDTYNNLVNRGGRDMKILAIGAHLDDIELACGGTLAKAIKNGHQVKVLIMSKSGYTNKEGKIQRSNDVAVKEGLDALHTLGIQDIEILDFPTKDIPFCSDVVNAIDIVISDYNPDVIFTHHPFDTHQAHEGVAKATIAAARRKNTVYFYEPIAPSGRSYVSFKPQMYVGNDETIDLKIDALKKHKSEYQKFGGEDWIIGVKSRCGFRGYEIGKKYAESFEILRQEMFFNKNTNL